MSIAHCFPSFHGLGGVESVLRHHWSRDSDWGLASRFVIYREDNSRPVERVRFLGLDDRSTIRLARQQFGEALAAAPPDVAMWHGPWGMPFLADLDRSQRRLLVLHGAMPRLAEMLASRRDLLDGIICVSEPLAAAVRRSAPRLADERTVVVPYPISPPGVVAPRAPLDGRPLVLGFCGRLIVEQKRVDRLPKLCAALDESGLDYRLEFLGDGPERSWLKAQFPNRTKFDFHGRKDGADYWRVLAGWDVVVSTSDYEGTPIAMLEAMSVGVIPVFPRIGCGGDSLAAGVLAELLYEAEDFARVAGVLGRLRRMPEAELQSVRDRCVEAVAVNAGDGYLRAVAGFIRRVLELPRVATGNFPRRVFPVEHLSFATLAKLSATRGWLRRQCGRTSS